MRRARQTSSTHLILLENIEIRPTLSAVSGATEHNTLSPQRNG